MSKENRFYREKQDVPTSKVIQIEHRFCSEGRSIIMVLCEDGSIWEKYLGKWECILCK